MTRPPVSPRPFSLPSALPKEKPAFDSQIKTPQNQNRDQRKKSNACRFRVPVVGALAFGFFVSPCLNDAASLWAQSSPFSPAPSTLRSATRPPRITQQIPGQAFNIPSSVSRRAGYTPSDPATYSVPEGASDSATPSPLSTRTPFEPLDSPLNPETYSVPQGATRVDVRGDDPFSLNPIKEQEIEASRFSSGLYGDPAPNNPSPFVSPNEASSPNPATNRPSIPPFFPESASDAEPSAARAHLEELAWAVGAWELETGGFVFQTKIDWAPGGSYLLCRDFVRPAVASQANEKEPTATFAALRVVGWNPVAGLYQSTIFCRDGSYGTGLWQREGEAWRVATRILLVDGRAATSVEYFTPRSEGGFSWESTARTVENAPLPNVGPAQARAVDPQIFERLERSTLNASPNADLPQTDVEFE
ncbi:MAG: hypothetical protein IKU86_09795 [Thermoguttaceae bacterium]|nr:hypothetical protein [Thermoguttaceae bacterium]